jgi:hypothetical protein
MVRKVGTLMGGRKQTTVQIEFRGSAPIIHLNRILGTIPRTSGIANQSINRLGHLILLEVVTEFVNAREGIQLALHDVKVIHVKTVNFGDGFHFIHIADGPNHMVLVGGK